VAEVNPGAASGVVRPGTEPKVRTDFKEKGHIRPRALSRKAKGSLARAGEVDAPLVSVKV
jgi:hypothetical protein